MSWKLWSVKNFHANHRELWTPFKAERKNDSERIVVNVYDMITLTFQNLKTNCKWKWILKDHLLDSLVFINEDYRLVLVITLKMITSTIMRKAVTWLWEKPSKDGPVKSIDPRSCNKALKRKNSLKILYSANRNTKLYTIKIKFQYKYTVSFYGGKPPHFYPNSDDPHFIPPF